MTRRTVQLTSTGVEHRVHLDGIDVSHALRGVELHLEAGALPTLLLDPVVYEVEQVSVEGVEVVLGPHVADLLVGLGWTPPAAEEPPC